MKALAYYIMILISIKCCDPNIKSVENASKPNYDGIDVSHHQGNINWERVANDSLIQFVYIKATEGASYVDPNYIYNLNEASKTRLKVGSYHYFRMTSSPKEQFKHIKRYIIKNKQDLIPMIDVEQSDGFTIEQVQDRLTILSRLIESYYGKSPIIYGTMRSYNTLLAPAFNSHHLYIGRYGNQSPTIIGGGVPTIWQFSEQGKIEGINTSVDMCRIMPPFTIEDILLID